MTSVEPNPKKSKVATAALSDPPLSEADPDLYAMIQQEEERQFRGLELIASENFTSRAVIDCIGSCLTNKYSEGLPGQRYYGGNEFIDQIENLCIQRALEAFHLNPDEWGVNVQPYSGSPANFAVYTAVLQPGDKLMGLDLPSGGHLTHGFQTAKKKISATSIYFESTPYKVHEETGLIDYDTLALQAKEFQPKLLIAGFSAYPRDIDYRRMREIADSVGALLMMDMAHISGLVAAQVLSDPFQYCDIVTTTTHKSLRGPRAGMIFFKKTKELDLAARINFAVFPSIQGGPHNNTIAGVAVQLKEVNSPAFKEYAHQIVKNAQALAGALTNYGYTLATGGTDNHLLLWDLRPQGITGNKVEFACDEASITLNKNSVHGDKSALSPGGVRVGTPALTTRGFQEADFIKVAGFLDRAVKIALNHNKEGVSLAEFKKLVKTDPAITALREDVHELASNFPIPGFNTDRFR